MLIFAFACFLKYLDNGKATDHCPSTAARDTELLNISKDLIFFYFLLKDGEEGKIVRCGKRCDYLLQVQFPSVSAQSVRGSQARVLFVY